MLIAVAKEGRRRIKEHNVAEELVGCRIPMVRSGAAKVLKKASFAGHGQVSVDSFLTCEGFVCNGKLVRLRFFDGTIALYSIIEVEVRMLL